MFFKMLSLKISQYSQESTCLESLFNKAAGLHALKRSWKFRIIHKKTPALESPATFIIRRLQHKYFPVKIAKFLETVFF